MLTISLRNLPRSIFCKWRSTISKDSLWRDNHKAIDSCAWRYLPRSLKRRRHLRPQSALYTAIWIRPRIYSRLSKLNKLVNQLTKKASKIRWFYHFWLCPNTNRKCWLISSPNRWRHNNSLQPLKGRSQCSITKEKVSTGSHSLSQKRSSAHKQRNSLTCAKFIRICLIATVTAIALEPVKTTLTYFLKLYQWTRS